MKRLLEAVHSGELAKLLTNEPRLSPPISSGRHRRFSPADVDELVRQYCDGFGSIYDLADQWGVHRNTIAKHLKERGLELGRQPLSKDEAERARQLHKEGLSLNAIGRALGRDPKTVKAALA